MILSLLVVWHKCKRTPIVLLDCSHILYSDTLCRRFRHRGYRHGPLARFGLECTHGSVTGTATAFSGIPLKSTTPFGASSSIQSSSSLSMSTIKSVKAREILDSRGNPTVEVRERLVVVELSTLRPLLLSRSDGTGGIVVLTERERDGSVPPRLCLFCRSFCFYCARCRRRRCCCCCHSKSWFHCLLPD